MFGWWFVHFLQRGSMCNGAFVGSKAKEMVTTLCKASSNIVEIYEVQVEDFFTKVRVWMAQA